MSKEKDKISRTLEHIAITFDKLGYSPTIPIFTGHQDFEYLFKLELGTIKELCNQQDQQIAELEEQLENAIVPKFKIGQEVYLADTYFDKVYALKISSISIFRREHYNHISYDGHLEESLFATKEEALAKLEEFKGENK